MSKILKDQQNIALAKSTGHQRSSQKADAETKAPKLKVKKTDKNSQMQPKKQRSYKSAPMRSRIIAKHFGGQSNRGIAEEEGIDRGTVGRILSRDEVVKMRMRCGSQLLALMPQAMDELSRLLNSRDERVRLKSVTKLVDVLQAFPKNGELWPEETSELDNNYKMQLYYQILESAVYKHHTYGIPVPPMDELKLLLLQQKRDDVPRGPHHES